jgi:predicted RNase H-like HicB family nuclease
MQTNLRNPHKADYSAYGPDLPGCVATGDTIDDVEREICAAIRFHTDGLEEDGLPVPAPTNRGVCRGVT